MRLRPFAAALAVALAAGALHAQAPASPPTADAPREGAPPAAGPVDPAEIRAALEAQIPELERRLEAWRGKRFLQPVAVEVRPRGEGDPAAAGWYEPETRRLVVTTERSERFRRGALLHELAHALQDQHFDLTALHQKASEDADAGRALAALIEGEAMLAVAELLDYDFSAHAALPAKGPVEESFYEKRFEYGDGLRFVRATRERGGWEAVDALFRDPPRASVAILRPERDPHAPPAEFGELALRGEPLHVARGGAYALRWSLVRDERTRARADALLAGFADDRRGELRRADGGTLAFWDLRFDDPAAAARFLAGARPALAAEGWRATLAGRDVRLVRP